MYRTAWMGLCLGACSMATETDDPCAGVQCDTSTMELAFFAAAGPVAADGVRWRFADLEWVDEAESCAGQTSCVFDIRDENGVFTVAATVDGWEQQQLTGDLTMSGGTECCPAAHRASMEFYFIPDE